MRRISCLALLLVPAVCLADDPARVRPEGEKSKDSRLGPPITLDGYFPFKPPASKEEWEARRKALREQVLVATGLWPMPEKTPLNAVVHGKIERDDYTIEKVYFASMPGHYVCGNLYRPKNSKGQIPAVLCPHGHWANGRFYDAGEANAKKQIEQKAEQTMEGAHYPLQARCAMLARMGCVVFHYDMIGVADSKAIAHTAGFTDAQAELRQQNFMGLQTWNSIRALDFLLGLPDVDPKRIGVTGASGGGTQTFMLCAVDDRPAVAFPAVMVSTAMQGGCICENCTGLRVGTGNVEIAGLFAPKPLGMSAANDWTLEIESKGLPELKALYRLYGAEENVMAKCHPEFGHNYNQVSRELMYNWFNKHLKLGQTEPVTEKPFVPVPPKELSVFDAEHPVPKDALPAEKLRQLMTEASDKQMEALMPKDAASLAEFKKVVGTALRVMVGEMPSLNQTVNHGITDVSTFGTNNLHKAALGRKGQGDTIPTISLIPKTNMSSGVVVIWIHPKGKASLFNGDKLVPAAQMIVDKNIPVIAPDVLYVGEQAAAMHPVDKRFAGYTYGYNRAPLAEQVRDIVTSVVVAKSMQGVEKVHVIGWESMGPATILASAVCGDAVDRTAADMDQFRFQRIDKTDDPMLLPGAVKYGSMGAFAALCAPRELYLHNHGGTSSGKLTKAAYTAANAKDNLVRVNAKVPPEKVVEWLLK
ncbi:MAG TPA: alpha/beta hydrolase family protein [Gemmataceae bacterium]|jgi:dienelactone hydrolase|nr:alpha/beta hydrolase family protein [Gemmataceae bacterium]